MEKWERELAEIRAIMKENAKGFAEVKQLQAESTANLTRIENLQAEQWEKYLNSIKETNIKFGGIDDATGRIAEDYFYNTLKETKTLGNVHFDIVDRDVKGYAPAKNGGTIFGQYDITLINQSSLGIVEVKNSVETKDVNKLVNEQVKNFKLIFEKYANYKFYLAIAGLTFTKTAEETARKYGMAILKLKGNIVEVQDSDLKVY